MPGILAVYSLTCDRDVEACALEKPGHLLDQQQGLRLPLLLYAHFRCSIHVGGVLGIGWESEVV
jgi:hypothetical protein